MEASLILIFEIPHSKHGQITAMGPPKGTYRDF